MPQRLFLKPKNSTYTVHILTSFPAGHASRLRNSSHHLRPNLLCYCTYNVIMGKNLVKVSFSLLFAAGLGKRTKGLKK